MDILQENHQNLVVFGFIRDVECYLSDNKIIPISITMLCIKYYESTNVIFFVSELKNQEPMYCIDADDNNRKKIPIKVHDLKTNTLITHDSTIKWCVHRCTLCYQRNINLPSIIVDDINNKQMINSLLNNEQTLNKKSRRNNSYHAVFKSSGNMANDLSSQIGYCSMILFNSSSLNSSQSSIDAINYELPKLPKTNQGNVLLFSDEYGLFSVGGKEERYCNSFYNLPFNEDDAMMMKWNTLNHMSMNRGYLSGVMAKSKTFKTESIFIIGGYSGKYINSIEMYDCEQLKNGNGGSWKLLGNCNEGRCRSGVCFDDLNDRIYICGGRVTPGQGTNTVEYYDVIKNKSFQMKHSVNKHKNYPLVWCENNDFLFITSVGSNCLEMLDMRVDSASWVVSESDLYDASLKTSDKSVMDDPCFRCHLTM